MSVVVLISAQAEWRVVRETFPKQSFTPSPYGEWMVADFHIQGDLIPVTFLHGGWGKIAAAASTQYVIDRWSPALLINLGTCGGFQGAIEPGTIILADRTLVYDIVEQMGDPVEALAHYTTEIDLSWLRSPWPQAAVRGLLLSGDRDLVPGEISTLHETFGGVAGDWESGAIAYVAARNGVRCLILRGVTDLVGPEGGEAYDGTMAFFTARTREVMGALLSALPDWIAAAYG